MKTQISPINKEEMDKLMQEIERTDEYDFLFFYMLKTTGRRVGELFGIPELKEVGRKLIGKKRVFMDGVAVECDRTIPIYKKTGVFLFGVKVKDLDLVKGIMKTWVLKRRTYVQDETLLTPEAIRLLNSYISKSRLNLEDYLFKKRTTKTMSSRLKNYALKVGINTNIVIHNFRHYFITELKRMNWSNDDIRKLTGHRSTAVLSIYDHVVASDLKDRALESIKKL